MTTKRHRFANTIDVRFMINSQGVTLVGERVRKQLAEVCRQSA